MPPRAIPASTWNQFQADTWQQETSGLLGTLQKSLAESMQPLRVPDVASALPSLPSLSDLTSGWGGTAPDQPQQAEQASSTGPSLPSLSSLTAGWGSTAPSRASTAEGAASGPAVAAGPAGEIDNASRESFVRTAWPHMLQAAGGNQDAAEMMLATAISENGSIGTGKPIFGNSYYGIKGQGDAGSVNSATHEIVNGQRQDIRDDFAAYSTPTVGAGAFFGFLETNPRYAPALARYRQSGDAAQLFRDVNAAGYATDPQWAAKVENIRANQVAPVTKGIGAPPQQTVGDQAGQTGMSTVGLDARGITEAYTGVPYVFGGPGGRSTSALGAPSDCSGFVASVYKHQFGLDLAAHTDTSYNQLRTLGAAEVGQADARPGDVVYYMGAGTGGAITHHMGLVSGPGRVLDMSTSGGGGVRERDIGHAGRYVILRDPRLHRQTPQTAKTPPPIVPSADSGGTRITPAEADHLAQAAGGPSPAGSLPVPPAPLAASPRAPEAGGTPLEWSSDTGSAPPASQAPAAPQPTYAAPFQDEQREPALPEPETVWSAFRAVNGRSPTSQELMALVSRVYGGMGGSTTAP